MDLLSSQVQNKETELAALRKDLSANASKLHAEHALKLSQYENELKICRSKLNEFEVQAMKLRHTT